MRFRPRVPAGLISLSLFAAVPMPASDDAAVLRRIHDEAVTTSPAYEQLRELTTRFPGRLSGTRALEDAQAWAEDLLEAMDLDRV